MLSTISLVAPVRQARTRRVRSTVLLGLADAWALSLCVLLLPGRLAVPFIGITVLAAAAQGCYRERFTGQLGTVLGRLFAAVSVSALAVGSLAPDWAAPLVRLALLVFVAMVIGRAVAGLAARTMLARSEGAPTLIVGAGPVGAALAADLVDHPEYGLRPVGVLDDVDDDELPLPLLGSIDDLARVVRAHGITHVIVAFGRAPEARLVDVIRTCEDLDAQVSVVPRLFELGGNTVSSDEIWGTPVVRLHRHALRSGQWRLKRIMDLVLAGGLLVITAPLLAVLAVAVKVSSPGPVLFRQARIGQLGRSFDMLKFRTLRVAPTLAACDAGSASAIQAARDADVSRRVTAVGAFLRKTSLDELPQLFNIIRGDMSVVGPRPEEVGFAATFSDGVRGYRDRHRVPVGLTGLAQIHGLRGDTSIEDRAAFDNRYIENWSLWGDVCIIVRTIWSVVRPPASVKFSAAPAEDASASEIDLRDEDRVPSIA